MRNSTLAGSIGVLGLIGAAACGADSGGGGSAGDARNQPPGNSLGDAGIVFGEIMEPDGGQNGPGGPNGGLSGEVCGVKTFDLQRLPGEVLLMLDRSGSMLSAPPGTRDNRNPDAKWKTVTEAIDESLAKTEATVNWGLNLFPLGSQCGVRNEPVVQVGASAGMAIQQAIGRNGPEENSATPTRSAVEAATTYLSGLSTPNPKFILLATDGQPNCLNGKPSSRTTDADGAINAVKKALAQGIPTFVLGIAVNDDAGKILNDMAAEGGRGRDGDIKYYPATNKDELVAAMSDIAGQVTSCRLNFGEVPPSPEDVAVKTGDVRVPRDKAQIEGWNYLDGQKGIELYGSWCGRLKNGSLKDINILFGCPGMVIP